MSTPRLHHALGFSLLLLLSLCATESASAAAEREIELEVGEQRVLPSLGDESYSEGVRGVIDVRHTQDGSSFVVVGQKVGITTLLFIMTDGREQMHRISVRARTVEDRKDAALEVRARDNVRLDFYFVQLSHEKRQQLGVGWPASLGATGSAAFGFDMLSGSFTQASAVVADQTLPRLDLAESEGWAKLLRKAAVITANGAQARWSGGGEINVPIEGGFGGSLRSIVYGSQIDVLPRYDRSTGRIELAIHADVSDLASDGGTGVPGRITSTLDSVVNVELGQSVVLAGLHSQTEAASRSGLPVLSDIPLLGGLFGSHGSQAQESESIVVIVPTVVDAVSLPSRELLREALSDFERYEGELSEAAWPNTLEQHRREESRR